ATDQAWGLARRRLHRCRCDSAVCHAETRGCAAEAAGGKHSAAGVITNPAPKVVHAPEKPEIKQISGQRKKCGEEHLGLGRRLVCWLHKVFPIHKPPNDNQKEWQTDSSYFAEDPVR